MERRADCVGGKPIRPDIARLCYRVCHEVETRGTAIPGRSAIVAAAGANQGVPSAIFTNFLPPPPNDRSAGCKPKFFQLVRELVAIY